MTNHLPRTQQEAYWQDGFLAGLPVFDADEVHQARAGIEALERDHADGGGGRGLTQFFRENGHVVLPRLAELARTPAILDPVESLLGSDLLVWSVELFIKEPGARKSVSWHQDITYWGMGETNEEVTAWVALSEVSREAGCMRFLPGSHRNGIVPHDDTLAPDNLLSRGQEIAEVDEAQAVHGPLRPGQMSLHHGRCFHASGPNGSDDRRIGLAVRYVTPNARDSAPGRDYAMPVRGADETGRWIAIAGARRLFDAADLRLWERIHAHQAGAIAAGIDGGLAAYG
jgi:hypothetical protein